MRTADLPPEDLESEQDNGFCRALTYSEASETLHQRFLYRTISTICLRIRTLKRKRGDPNRTFFFGEMGRDHLSRYFLFYFYLFFFFDFHLPCRGKAAWLAANQDLKQDPAYGKKWILDNVFVFRHQTISPFLTIFARNFQSRISRDFCRIFDLLKDPKKSGPKKKRWAVGEVVDEIQDPRQLECS